MLNCVESWPRVKGNSHQPYYNCLWLTWRAGCRLLERIMKPRLLIALGALNGLLAVAMGAFGAHGLKHLLTGDLREVFETGARYHIYHALALVLVGVLAVNARSRWLGLAGTMFLLGILLFSGSLYALAITAIRGLGAITPFGGVAFLLGWCFLITFALTGGKDRTNSLTA